MLAFRSSYNQRVSRFHTYVCQSSTVSSFLLLQVHGEHCSSSSLPLGTTTDNFEQGEEDVFTVSLPSDMGAITAITVGHDNTQPYPDWHLDHITMESGCGQEKYTFPCGRYVQ